MIASDFCPIVVKPHTFADLMEDYRRSRAVPPAKDLRLKPLLVAAHAPQYLKQLRIAVDHRRISVEAATDTDDRFVETYKEL